MAREEGFFDELARGLADGSITRGKALRLMGAALVGGSLASLGTGEAGADPPGCKRAGKHCTRTDQCCGTLVCVSGTCQTPTTSTTETPTTSTTETPTTTTTETPTTSTSTSTTSTTPMCLPPGESCTADDECCSRVCVQDRFGGGVCAPEPPICDPPCPANCSCVLAADGTTTICIGCSGLCIIREEASCGQCTTNEVCVAGSPGFVGCAPACTVSTTSTTTSTTSTSTTTCSGLPNGASCNTSTDCCSGNCTGGFCCESGRVGLSNGTCAKPCASGADCPASACAGTSGCILDASGATYCVGTVTLTGSCPNGDSDCPQGQFCGVFGPQRSCVPAC
jgi:hypothetical protein